MLSQILYISTAPGLAREDVDAILAVSERNNPAKGVTGLLLYNGRNFLQLLEGGKEELYALMERISADPRHSGISVMHSGEVNARVCPDWAMKRVVIAESIDERRETLASDLPETLDANVRQMILNFTVLN